MLVVSVVSVVSVVMSVVVSVVSVVVVSSTTSTLMLPHNWQSSGHTTGAGGLTRG